MARVKCLTSLAGVNFSFAPGQEAEFADDEAARLVAAGYAEYLTPPVPRAADAASPGPPAATTKQRRPRKG